MPIFALLLTWLLALLSDILRYHQALEASTCETQLGPERRNLNNSDVACMELEMWLKSCGGDDGAESNRVSQLGQGFEILEVR